MARKFMIIKPLPCCGHDSGLGMVGVYKEAAMSGHGWCGRCGAASFQSDVFVASFPNIDCLMTESRIVWLPDESDVIDQDIREELAA
jgi:hypothetical protein